MLINVRVDVLQCIFVPDRVLRYAVLQQKRSIIVGAVFVELVLSYNAALTDTAILLSTSSF